jgi:NAD dependent epimerase/dehydratase family enzyme
MRVLVTGGKGFIGRALVRALAERGDEPIVVSRARGAVGWDAVPREVERADAVVHFAGEPVAGARWTPSRIDLIRSSRVRTTETLAGAIEHAGRKPRVFVSGSAVGV